ncbi:MAG: hypothetical protein GC191_09535 [Azospirillum sp.]|nr:hypothetical protein [Azospirillum sp.]
MAPLPAWVSDYVGIPWALLGRDRSGCDCWGLFRLVQREVFGLELPSYGYDDPLDLTAAARLLSTHPDRTQWAAIEAGQTRVGDGLLLTTAGRPVHVGLVASSGLMLHTEQATGAVVDTYAGIRWRNRLGGFWRWTG